MSSISANMPLWHAVPAFELECEPISGAAIMAPLLETATSHATERGADVVAAMIARCGTEPELLDEFMRTLIAAAVEGIVEHEDRIDQYFVVAKSIELLMNGVTNATIEVNEDGKWLAVGKFVCHVLAMDYLEAAGYDMAADPYMSAEVAA